MARLRMKFSAPSGNASSKAPGTTASIPIRPVQLIRNRVPARAIRARLTAYTVAGTIDCRTDYAGRDAELGGPMSADRTITQILRIKVWPRIRASSHRCFPLCRAARRRRKTH